MAAFSDQFVGEPAAVLFRRLHRKALALGLNPEQISSLKSLEKFKAKGKEGMAPPRPRQGAALGFLALALAAAFCAACAWNWPLVATLIYGESDIRKQPCIIGSEYLADFVRPPVNCQICRSVRAVDRVSNITAKNFEDLYAYSGRPVVVVDGSRNWTATRLFSFEYFRGLYGSDNATLENGDISCQFFPYQTEFTRLMEVFEMSDERARMKDGSKPWYIGWSNCDRHVAGILRQHYSRPYFLPEDSESSRVDWIFMGSPGYGAAMHIDSVEHPSWQAQIVGKKKWTLEPPPECYDECEKQLEVTVNPGEIIVLDTNIWYHSTLNVGDDISITIGSEYD